MEEEVGDADGTLAEEEEQALGYALKQDVFYHLQKPYTFYSATTEKPEIPNGHGHLLRLGRASP